MKRGRSLSEYQLLQTVSLAYLSLPTVIFILGWLKPVYALPLTALVIAGFVKSTKSGWDFGAASHESRPRFLENPVVFYGLTLLLVVVAAICSGAGGFAIQDGDYTKHNGFFLDLTNFSWPLAYQNTGMDAAPRVLNTYLAYYLPSALVGKLFGFAAAYLFSFVWFCSGLFLTLLWVNRFLSRRSLLLLVLFVLFGELAYFGWTYYFPGQSSFGRSYNYPNWMYFHSVQSPVLKGVFWILGSNHTFLANGPHHVFPSWICILMVFHDAVFRKSVDRSGFVFAFVPFVSAFMAIGLSPFILLAAVQNRFRGAVTVQNLVVAPLLLLVAGLYLVSNNAQFTRGWIWDFIDLQEAWRYILHFFVFSFGIYLLVMPKKPSNFPDRSMVPWLYTAIGCIALFSLYRIGKYMDFPIKAYNPSWIVFQVCVLASVSHARTAVEKSRSAVVILLILIGSIGAFSNVTFALKNGLFTRKVTESTSEHINLIGPKDLSLALFSDGDSLFWKVLAKEPVYSKTPPR